MTTTVKSELTLRTARGVVDLLLREIDEATLIAEGEHRLRSGREAEFQFALPGANANLRGHAEVVKVVKLALSPSRTTLRITEMNANDRGILREWLSEQARLQAARKPTKKPPPPSVEEIRGMRSGSLTSTLGDPEAGIGRQAISEAITQAPGGAGGRRSRVRRGVEDRRSSGDTGAGRRRGRRRVEVKVASSASPPIVMIRFNDPERYVSYYWKHLHRDTLQVRFQGAELEKGADVSVRLVLPGGSMVQCSGVVKVVMPTGFGIVLELTDSARSTLRLSAGPRPRTV
jgi:hypothetical protein